MPPTPEAPKFGTSGLRGLVTALTPECVGAYTQAFLRACPAGTGLWVGRDLRPSSPQIAGSVIRAAGSMGIPVTDCGEVPTPALALAAMKAGAAAVMITGSHIPADRNGLKFYLPAGEISKADEMAILAALARADTEVAGTDALRPALRATDKGAGAAWIARYVTAFGPQALAGLRLGVWSHSAVSRDLLIHAVTAMGGTVLELGRSDQFIPIDTEAVAPAVRAALAAWAAEHRLDGILSTDGDGDRPLLCDAEGQVIAGDILGQITAAIIGAEIVVTPVSSNSGAEAGGHFQEVIRTKIGSPFVIAGMDSRRTARVAGYEANGGFLLGFGARGPAGPLPPLATRDSLLPMIAPLSQARAAGGLRALVARQPARFTAADRLEGISPEAARGFLSAPARIAAFIAPLGESVVATDATDGQRLTFASGRILHMRPSGNAPEFRLYTEAESPQAATDLLTRGLAGLNAALAGGRPAAATLQG